MPVTDERRLASFVLRVGQKPKIYSLSSRLAPPRKLQRNSFWNAHTHPAVSSTPLHDIFVLNIYGSDYCVLKGASLSSVRTFFGDLVYKGIDQSGLRRWETKMQRLETTDCVELELREENSTYGRLRLRIGNQVGLPLTNQLYV